MQIQLTAAGLRAIFPRAPQSVIDAFVKDQGRLAAAGILSSDNRLVDCFANVSHECAGFALPSLTENIRYTRARAKQVWPSRASQIDAIPGSGPAFQKALMNAMYGGRMGNRAGTDDGFLYIGRGACQHTGRDGYEQMQKRTGIPLAEHPERAALPEHQPALIAAFWSWKLLSKYSDAGDFRGLVRAWNGGQIGMADRLAERKRIAPIVAALPRTNTPPPKVEPPKPADGLMEPEPKVERKGGKEAVAGIGAVITAGLAYAADSPWILIAGVALIAAGFVAYLLIKKG